VTIRSRSVCAGSGFRWRRRLHVSVCSASFVSVPQGKWLRTLNQATAASHVLSSPFFTDPITRYYVMVCGSPSHFIYGHLFTSIQGGFQQAAEPVVISYRLLPVALIDTHRPLTRRPNLVVQRSDIHLSPSSPMECGRFACRRTCNHFTARH
jgi:hypothetical protein